MLGAQKKPQGDERLLNPYFAVCLFMQFVYMVSFNMTIPLIANYVVALGHSTAMGGFVAGNVLPVRTCFSPSCWFRRRPRRQKGASHGRMRHSGRLVRRLCLRPECGDAGCVSHSACTGALHSNDGAGSGCHRVRAHETLGRRRGLCGHCCDARACDWAEPGRF